MFARSLLAFTHLNTGRGEQLKDGAQYAAKVRWLGSWTVVGQLGGGWAVGWWLGWREVRRWGGVGDGWCGTSGRWVRGGIVRKGGQE